MTESDLDPAPDRAALRAILAMIVLCTVIELLMQLGDAGLFGGPRLRTQIYEYFGFWPGLLHGWQPNYAIQPWSMFLTYALLHGSFMHLFFNMATLWSLAPAVADRVRLGGLVTIYVAGIVGGSVLQGVLATSTRPMVGASGALFALAGALVVWNYKELRLRRVAPWPVIYAILMLSGINLAMWWALEGQLAWQAHLGGFVAGWLTALAVDRS